MTGPILAPDGPACAGVVLCPGRDGDASGLAWLAESLRAAGAAVLPVSYGDGRYVADDVPVARAAGEALRATLGLSAPVVVAGHSRGGTVALLAAAAGGWDGAIALSATTDQVRLVEGLAAFAPSRYRTMIAARRATPAEDPGYYAATSPLLQASSFDCPVLLVHGTLDLVVPHDHTLWMQEALDAAGGEVELHLVTGAGHFFERTYHGYAFAEVADAVAGWLRATVTA